LHFSSTDVQKPNRTKKINLFLQPGAAIRSYQQRL
jgi:hypothetical protein